MPPDVPTVFILYRSINPENIENISTMTEAIRNAPVVRDFQRAKAKITPKPTKRGNITAALIRAVAFCIRLCSSHSSFCSNNNLLYSLSMFQIDQIEYLSSLIFIEYQGIKHYDVSSLTSNIVIT